DHLRLEWPITITGIRSLHPARAQAACQGADRHLSKPPTFTARWRRSANRVVKGPSPKGTATARLRRFQPFHGPMASREVHPKPPNSAVESRKPLGPYGKYSNETGAIA